MRGWALFWCLFIGIGAIAGGSGMLADRSGQILRVDAMLPMMQVLPFADQLFKDFLIPGIALIVVIGATNLLTFFLLLSKKNGLGITFSVACGIILMLWTSIQFFIFPMNILSPLYFLFGLIQLVNAINLYRREIHEYQRNRHNSMF